MSASNGGPAFPCGELKHDHDIGALVPSTEPRHAGMSLRDWFASQALAGFCYFRSSTERDFDAFALAEDAYVMADAMLKERAK